MAELDGPTVAYCVRTEPTEVSIGTYSTFIMMSNSPIAAVETGRPEMKITVEAAVVRSVDAMSRKTRGPAPNK
jgi:hypothetical protein